MGIASLPYHVLRGVSKVKDTSETIKTRVRRNTNEGLRSPLPQELPFRYACEGGVADGDGEVRREPLLVSQNTAGLTGRKKSNSVGSWMSTSTMSSIRSEPEK